MNNEWTPGQGEEDLSRKEINHLTYSSSLKPASPFYSSPPLQLNKRNSPSQFEWRTACKEYIWQKNKQTKWLCIFSTGKRYRKKQKNNRNFNHIMPRTLLCRCMPALTGIECTRWIYILIWKSPLCPFTPFLDTSKWKFGHPSRGSLKHTQKYLQ